MQVTNADGDIRYVPSEHVAHGDLTSIAHEGRYAWFAGQFPIEGKAVLDFGCGSGYGTGLMAARGAQATGVDISPTAIEHAKREYPRAAFLDLDLTAPSVPQAFGQEFDFVVSFDVIEHVEKYWEFVRNIRRLLAKDGTAVIGCPNRLATFDFNLEWNPYHVQEFSPAQLSWLLRTQFSSVKMMAQDFVSDAARGAHLAVRPSALWHIKYGLAKSPVGPALMKLKSLFDRFPSPQAVAVSPVATKTTNESGLVKFEDLDIDDAQAVRRPFGLVAICSGYAEQSPRS